MARDCTHCGVPFVPTATETLCPFCVTQVRAGAAADTRDEERDDHEAEPERRPKPLARGRAATRFRLSRHPPTAAVVAMIATAVLGAGLGYGLFWVLSRSTLPAPAITLILAMYTLGANVATIYSGFDAYWRADKGR